MFTKQIVKAQKNNERSTIRSLRVLFISKEILRDVKDQRKNKTGFKWKINIRK